MAEPKRCPKCKRIKSVSEFYRSKSTKDGLTCWCRNCIKQRQKQYNKAYRLLHKKEISAYRKAYDLANKKKLAARTKAYHLANKKKINAKHNAYYLAHRKEAKAYRLAHKKEIAEWQKKYRQKYSEEKRDYNRKYSALKRGNNHEPYTEAYIFERDGWICGICGRKINKRLKRPNPLSKSIDHIIPVSKGGIDASINVQAAHLRCNMIKQAQSGGQLRLIG